MKDEVTIVFLHGAGTGPWIWQSVLDSLPGATVALAVPSRHDKASPESRAKALVAEMDALGFSRVAVAMHSLAGVLGPELATRLGDRLVTAIFLAAVIPRQASASWMR